MKFAAIPRIVITRKPPPPPLPSFVCAICETETERNPHNPDFERPPVCFRCNLNAPTRPQLAHTDVEQWRAFTTAHALICAINQEAKRGQRTR